jgi:hypothetical protein
VLVFSNNDELIVEKNAFQNIKEEQKVLATRDGDVLSLWQLNKKYTYLNMEVKEIMQNKPLA